MRILLVSMGIGIYSAHLARALARQAHSIRLLLVEKELDELRAELPLFFSDVPFSLGVFPTLPDLTIRRFFYLALETWRVMARRYDVVHITSVGPALETAVIAFAARWSKTPLVLTIHDAQFHPGDIIGHRSFRLLLRIMDCTTSFIVHGEQIALVAEANLLVERFRLSIIPAGNWDMYLETSPPDARSGRKQVLFFGRMKKYKGLDVLLQAAPLLREKCPQARIVIAGSGPELDRLQPECNLHDNVEVLKGYIRTKDVGRLFAGCDVVVLPYIEASQSGPLLTAFSFGKPVVASRVGSIPEAVTHGVEGLLVRPGDPHELADALSQILNDDGLARSMGRAARKAAEGPHSWSTIAEKTVAVYAESFSRRKITRTRRTSGNGWLRMKEYYEGCVRERNR